MTYELRRYGVAPGRLDYLLNRFEEASLPLLARHNIAGIGFWQTQEDEPALVYLVRHDGDAARAWEAFYADPDWHSVLADPNLEGCVTSVTSTFLNELPFSPRLKPSEM